MGIDQDGSGEVTSDELVRFLRTDSLKKYLEALDITAEDTRMLYKMLDTDGSGYIDIDEFCHGCMKLKGEAKSFDIHVLMYQMKSFMDVWSDFTLYCEQRFTHMTETAANLSSQMRQTMRQTQMA